jgi:hypothetical protein
VRSYHAWNIELIHQHAEPCREKGFLYWHPYAPAFYLSNNRFRSKAARTEGVESTEQSSTTMISSRLEIFKTFCMTRDRSLFIENRYYDASPRSDGQAQVRTPNNPPIG